MTRTPRGIHSPCQLPKNGKNPLKTPRDDFIASNIDFFFYGGSKKAQKMFPI
jgi:hypothetical protein